MKPSVLHLIIRVLTLLGIVAMVGVILNFFYRGSQLFSLGYLVAGAFLFFCLVALVYIFMQRGHTEKVFSAVVLTVGLLLASGTLISVYGLEHAVRVTFVNSTDRPVSNIKLSGCITESLPEIPAGGSTTTWINNDECKLTISYLHNSNLYIRTIFNALPDSLQGQELTYDFGKSREALDAPLKSWELEKLNKPKE
jgi:hypothetical protein